MTTSTIDAQDRALRLDWIQFTETDRQLIREAAKFLRPESKEIAKEFYGSANRWHEIYDANRDQISNPDLIKPGRPLDLKGATFSPSIPPATATGKSLSFNGSGQYAVADLNVSEDSYTVAFWFKTTNPNVGLYSVTLGPQGVSGNDRHLYLTSGNIAARLYNNQVISSTGKNYADGQWHYVAHVYNRNTIGQRVYVDGQQVASGTTTGRHDEG